MSSREFYVSKEVFDHLDVMEGWNIYVNQNPSQEYHYPIEIKWDNPKVDRVSVPIYLNEVGRQILLNMKSMCSTSDWAYQKDNRYEYKAYITIEIPKDREITVKESQVRKVLEELYANGCPEYKDKFISKLFTEGDLK